MSNYLLLLSFFSIQLIGMQDSSLDRFRFDSAINDEIDPQNEAYAQAKRALSLMENEDQNLRRQALRAGQLYNKQAADLLSKKHVHILKNIIKQFGWPSQAHFDEDCSFAAWLVAQHANHDLHFQKQACNYISQLNERFASIYWIFLTDRILVNENKPQLYGTQYTKDGTLYPIADPNNLERRRKDMQLSQIEYYQDFMALKFNQLKRVSPALPSQ